MTAIPFFVRLRGLMARDKDAFWWNYFTDEELKLRGMDVWQLAKVIQEAAVTPGMELQRIVAEHLLNVRLAAVQAKASWGAGLLGFVGALLGAALSVVLAPYFQAAPQVPAKSVACASGLDGLSPRLAAPTQPSVSVPATVDEAARALAQSSKEKGK